MGLTVFDAGPIIALLESGDVFHTQSAMLYEQLRTTNESLMLPLSALAEVLVKPWLHGREAVEELERGLAVLRFTIQPPGREIAREAARLRARHGAKLRLPDALVVATAVVQRADRVITTDGRWPADLGVNVEVLPR